MDQASWPNNSELKNVGVNTLRDVRTSENDGMVWNMKKWISQGTLYDSHASMNSLTILKKGSSL